MSLRLFGIFFVLVMAGSVAFGGRVAGKSPAAPTVAVTTSPFQLQRIASGLSNPLFVTHAGDGSGRLFILEQYANIGGVLFGQIRIMKNGAVLPTPFLTLGPVGDQSEQGLLGLAFHPQFATNRRFFVHYVGADGAIRIAEYTASVGNPDVANPTGTVLLTLPKLRPNHNGGTVAFGPDGYLYVSIGDGGGPGDPDLNGQNINTLFAKILRLDVSTPGTYTIPPTNPFAGATPGADEVFAYGLRNPFRFSFDRQTGQLYAGDVGQNLREEVDIIVNGANYGWSRMEGSICFAPPDGCDMTGITLPITDYGHDIGCSIIGGFVYRGTRIPELTGTYLFGDFCSGKINGYKNGTTTELFSTGFIVNFASFGEDEAGELYVCTLTTGTIEKLVPLCDFTIQPPSTTLPESGGTVSVAVNVNGGCAWTVAGTIPPWLSATPGNGTGSGTVNVVAEANRSTSSRSASFTIAGQPFSVTQDPAVLLNSSLALSITSSSPAPATCPGYGADYLITADVTNVGSLPLNDVYFEVAELREANGVPPALPFRLLSATNATCSSGGTGGAQQSVAANLAPGATQTVTFRIALPSLRRFRFVINGYGAVGAPLMRPAAVGKKRRFPDDFNRLLR